MTALTRDGLKQLLAYSTISQYGYVVVLIAIGGKAGMVGACLYVLAHALMKSALFLTAGAVTEATGVSTLHEVGGLARRMPWLAAASGIAAAGLAGLPLTIGFFKDELYFHAALAHGGAVPVLAVLSAALTLAYSWRFWSGIFLGPRPSEPQPIDARLVAPVVILSGLVLLGGFWMVPFSSLSGAAAGAIIGEPIDPKLAYHLVPHGEQVMTLAAWVAGVLLIMTGRLWAPLARAVAQATATAGPKRAFDSTISGLNRLSDAVHRLEVRDLRSRVATILLPAGVLVGTAVVVQHDLASLHAGSLTRHDLPLIGMVVIASAAALVAAMTPSHLGLSLLLSAVGYSLSIIYALLGAPDVALVAVLIETAFTILLAGMIMLLPASFDYRILPREELGREVGPSRTRRFRDAGLGVIAGLLALAVTWSVLSEPAALETVAIDQIRLAPDAHGRDVVTVILADFRGLDTMGEITVIGIAFLGVATLLRRRRERP